MHSRCCDHTNCGCCACEHECRVQRLEHQLADERYKLRLARDSEASLKRTIDRIIDEDPTVLQRKPYV